ncbi:MAG: sigma factor [Solirubrobacteraceae bacterium]
MAVFRAAPRYRPTESTAAGWLFTIAHNRLANGVRSRRVADKARIRLGIREA